MIREEITSYVDNELRDIELRIYLSELIRTNDMIKCEYLIQKEMKDLLRKKLPFCCTPKCVCDKILNNLYNELNPNILE